jgi:hypothetical protein
MSISAAFALASLIGAPTPPAPSPSARPEELVRLLGDKSYRIREVAARELVRRGSAAVDALTAATKDTDPEVSERAKQLLPQAAAVERNEKLAQLLKDPAAPPPKGLAGLDRFLKAAGDGKESRELYAEMMSIHYRTIEAADGSPKTAAELFGQFCNEAYQKWQIGARTGRYSYDNLFSGRADITFFLFMSADNRLRQYDNGINRSSILFNGTQITKAVTDKDGSPAMRKLFLDWLEKEPQSYLQQRGFLLAAQANIKEALPILLRLLEKKDQDPYGKAQVMVALVKLGTKEHIKVLDPYLTDKTQITTINFGNGPQLSVQTRDVAMGVQVQLAGQKLTDYGFDNRFGGGGLSYHYYGFPDDADNKSKARDEAHAKWKEWKSKNLGKEPDPKKGPDPKITAEKGPPPAEKKPAEKK